MLLSHHSVMYIDVQILSNNYTMLTFEHASTQKEIILIQIGNIPTAHLVDVTSSSYYTWSQVSQLLRWNKIWGIWYFSKWLRYEVTVCCVMCHQTVLQWSHLVFPMWLSFEDSILKPSWVLYYEEAANNVTIKSHGDFQVTETLL